VESLSPEVLKTQAYLRSNHLDPVYLNLYNKDPITNTQQNFYQYVSSTKLKVRADIRNIRTKAVQDKNMQCKLSNLESKQKLLLRHNEIVQLREENIETGVTWYCQKFAHLMWIRMILLVRMLHRLQEMYKMRLEHLQTEGKRLYSATIIQRVYRRKFFWKLVLQPVPITNQYLFWGLQTVAHLLKERARLSNKRRLALYFSPMVRCYTIKFLFDHFISDQIAFINRFKRHSRNVKLNYKMFMKSWDKEVMTLFGYEEFQLKRKKLLQSETINISDAMTKFSKDFKWKLYKTIYNARLIPFLQGRYWLKQYKKREKEQADKKSLVIPNEKKLPVSRKSLRVDFGDADTLAKLIEGEKKIFDLDKVIEFPGLMKNLHNDDMYQLYMEAVERWDSGFYDSQLSHIQKMVDVKNPEKKSLTSPGSIVGKSFLSSSFKRLSCCKKDLFELDHKMDGTVAVLKGVFGDLESQRFVLEIPVEFTRVLILTGIDF
jgi:hypothetical protein